MEDLPALLILFAAYLAIASVLFAIFWGFAWLLKKCDIHLLRPVGVWPWAILLGLGLAPEFVAAGHSAVIVPIGLRILFHQNGGPEFFLFTLLCAPVSVFLVFRSLRSLAGREI